MREDKEREGRIVYNNPANYARDPLGWLSFIASHASIASLEEKVEANS